MAISKVVYGNNVLIDLTADTVLPEHLIKGYTAHGADGVQITGTNDWDSNTQDATAADSEILSGKTAYVEVGTYNFIALPRFYMQCKDGTALITDWREEAQGVKCKYWHENDVLPVQTAAGITKTMAPRDSVTTDTYRVARPASDVHDFYRHFVNAIRTGEAQDVTYDQMRTVTLNYETLTNIYYARRNHKLDEWHTFCDMICALPYAKALICCHDDGEK